MGLTTSSVKALGHGALKEYRLREGRSGFTLMELLIALSVLSLLMLLLTGGLRFGSRAWERADHVSNVRQEIDLGRAFLTRHLKAAYPMMGGKVDGISSVRFDGSARNLVFVTTAPRQLKNHSFVEISLSLVPHGGAVQLRVVGREVGANSMSTALFDETVLSGIKSLSLSYYGASTAGGTEKWSTDWKTKSRPPKLIKVAIKFLNETNYLWDDLIISPKIDVDVSCVYDPLTQYCKGR